MSELNAATRDNRNARRDCPADECEGLQIVDGLPAEILIANEADLEVDLEIGVAGWKVQIAQGSIAVFTPYSLSYEA
jgi:hypothetical protein